ncbi:MAG TPA: ribosome silencing factor [Afifellaceae bacterium]|nr:ribosome silencing factor [Afifellaceae bacterium]
MNTTRHDESVLSGTTHPVPRDAQASEGSLAAALASLEDSKAEELITIDISGKSALGDHMVVASGRSHRHVGAIADHLVRDLKQAGYGPVRVEGLPHCDWVLVDIGDVIIHLFRPEVRAFYNIEKMWQAEPYSDRPETS